VTEGLRVELRAGGRSPAQARQAVTGWLRRVCRRGELCEVTDDLVFAVSEAVTNCVDHAYRDGEPGPIRVEGSVVEEPDRSVTVAVSDDGAWAEPGEPGYRGRGLSMIRASVTSLAVDAGRTGTTLTMTQRLGC
jgi:serine/threonine-protein kinase RsbW